MECITEENVKQIIEQPEYLLFYFTASWCGPCQKIKPQIIKLKEGLQTNNIKFYMIDIDENNLISIIKDDPVIKKHLNEEIIKKTIYIKNKLINILI